MRTIDNYQLKPTVVRIQEREQSIDLKNDVWILNTKALPKHLTGLELVSSDNVFQAAPEEYEQMDEYRYRTFSDYIDVKADSESFTPFRLEFVKIVPHRN